MSKKGGFKMLLGLIAGATAGLLFAPGKGKTLRKNIKDEMNKEDGDVKKVVSKHLKGVVKDLGEVTEEAAEKMGIDVDKTKEKAKEAGAKVKETAMKAKDKTVELADKLKGDKENETEV